MVGIALEVVPDLATIVPEKRQEITTEGGLDVIGNRQTLESAIGRLVDKGIEVSLFIDPDQAQIDLSREIGAHCVELHTGEYANAVNADEQDFHLTALIRAARHAADLGLEVHAGHGLTYRNVGRIAAIGEIEGLYIGHSIMSRAVFVGLDRAVKDMIQTIEKQ